MDHDRLMVNRLGDHAQSFMKTDAIIGQVEPGQKYRVTLGGLIPTDAGVSEEFAESRRGRAPAHVRLRGSWKSNHDKNATDANILGGFGTLSIEGPRLGIPRVEATEESLGFYGARLVKIGDVIEFETNAALPVTLMSVGSTYVDHYLKIEDRGGGVYIERHDRPHLHLPIEESAAGHMIIGHSKNDEYTFSAFEIPFGYGIYTPPHLLHADAFLIGRFLVVYSVTDNFSTVIFRSSDHALVDVYIVKK